MIASRVSATLILTSLISVPIFSQWPTRGSNGPTPARAAAAQDNQIVIKRRVYDSLVAKGLQRTAAAAAAQLALAYEQRFDYADAATWWQTAYTKGNEEGLLRFLNLVISNKVTIGNPDGIRPLVEVRAFCGSQMARAYVLSHWHETPAQLPDYTGKTAGKCALAGPDDHMNQSLMIAASQRHTAEANSAYYKQHPEEDPEFKRQQAIEGAALLFGALVIQAAAMPASGQGSIACNKYQNGSPGATDPSVCNTPLK